MRNILKCLKQFDWFLTIYKNDAYRKLILAIESLREFIGKCPRKKETTSASNGTFIKREAVGSIRGRNIYKILKATL